MSWYRQLCLQVSANGGKVTKSFEEVFPEYGTDDEKLDVTPEAAKLIERLQAEQEARAANHGVKRTSNTNKR
jgi:hypothetical protein